MTPEQIAALPYRPCVGLMLIGPRGRVFAGQRVDNPGEAWQMPQGGIDPDETPRAAALRELREETGAGPHVVEVLRESADWIPYDLPAELLPRLWGGRYRGQSQKWFALRFTGADDDIDISGPPAEFRNWDWLEPERLMALIVPFKRDVYARVFDEFADLLR